MNLIEITNTYESAEEAYADWSFTSNPEVMKVIERAAWRMANQYESTRTIEYEDAHQEGLILVATHARLRECLTDPGLGLGVLHTRLTQRLVHKVETEAKRRSGQLSYEAVVDSYAPESV